MKKVAIVGGGVAGIGVAWVLQQKPDHFDFRLYEAKDQIGGNAVTADMHQDDGSTIPFDISVTACIPSVYHHILDLADQLDIELMETTFSYSVEYFGELYAHDLDTPISRALEPEIEKFQRMLRRIKRLGWLNRTRSKFLNALNPFNYLSMGTVLNLGNYSSDFRYKVLKPMFVNFLMATNVFDMPASLFCRYLEFFDIVAATPMRTWRGGTRQMYDRLVSDFQEKIYLERPVRKVHRFKTHVLIEDANGDTERFDEAVLACNANQSLMAIAQPTYFETWLLSSIRYESELHNHAIVHSDASVLPDNEARPLQTRSNHIVQYGARPDNYEITYIMHNQQPWANGSDKPCLVTYNPMKTIDPSKVLRRTWFQHVVHDVKHVALLVHLFRFIQGKRRTWHCGAHTLINSQETCFVTGLAIARQLGADYPFEKTETRRWFNFYGRVMFGWRFKKATPNS